MELFTKVFGRMVIDMVKGYNITEMEMSIMVILIKVKWKDLVNIFGQMEILMKENIRLV